MLRGIGARRTRLDSSYRPAQLTRPRVSQFVTYRQRTSSRSCSRHRASTSSCCACPDFATRPTCSRLARSARLDLPSSFQLPQLIPSPLAPTYLVILVLGPVRARRLDWLSWRDSLPICASSSDLPGLAHARPHPPTTSVLSSEASSVHVSSTCHLKLVPSCSRSIDNACLSVSMRGSAID